MSLLKRAWIPLVIVVVVAIAGFMVMRIRTFFGAHDTTGISSAVADDTKPFDPKVVKYEIFGEPGAYADINYLDLDAQPQRVDGATLPWSLTLSTTAPSVFPNIVAQGDGDTITCRVTVDDEVKDERTSNGVKAQTFCLVKSA
jgi:Mycobacterium membrane protein